MKAEKKEAMRQITDAYIQTMMALGGCSREKCGKEGEAQGAAQLKNAAAMNKLMAKKSTMTEAEFAKRSKALSMKNMYTSSESKAVFNCEFTKCMDEVMKHIKAQKDNHEFQCQNKASKSYGLDCSVAQLMDAFIAKKGQGAKEYAKLKADAFALSGGKRRTKKLA